MGRGSQGGDQRVRFELRLCRADDRGGADRVLAQRFGGRIEWDAKNMKVTNRPELNAFVREPVRSGWEMGADLWS